MRNARDFNPYMIHVNFSTVPPKQILIRRMCMWYEIELITAAEGGGVLTEGEFLPARRGTLYVRRPGMIVRGQGAYTHCGVIFDAAYHDAMEPYYALRENCLSWNHDPVFLTMINQRDCFFSFLETLPASIEVRNYDLIYSLLHSCFHFFLDKPADYHLYIKSLLLQIITTLRQEMLTKSPDDASSAPSMLHIRRHIDTHYMEPINLDMLARKAMLSREYLCRLFKRVVGKTPIDYLQTVRIFHAKQLLIITNDKVDHIAEQCGFSSEQYFYQSFKQCVGTTPGKYRAERQRSSQISDDMHLGG